MQRLKKNDKVVVLAGKDKGRQAKLLAVYPQKAKVLVESVNVVKRHHKSRGQNDPSRIIEVAKPLAWSKVQLVCPHCHKPTRVGIRIDKTGLKGRFCKRCQQLIDNSGGK